MKHSTAIPPHAFPVQASPLTLQRRTYASGRSRSRRAGLWRAARSVRVGPAAQTACIPSLAALPDVPVALLRVAAAAAHRHAHTSALQLTISL